MTHGFRYHPRLCFNAGRFKNVNTFQRLGFGRLQRGAEADHRPFALATDVARPMLRRAGDRSGARSRGFKILGGLLLAYAAQGLIAEWLGVRVTPDAVTSPKRFANAPCFTLWRKRVSLDRILDITSRSKSLGFERVVLRTSPSDRILMLFPNRETKLAFFSAVRTFAPKTSIYRR